MKRIWEIRYKLGADDTEQQMIDFINDQRVIKGAEAGEIDDIRLITGMRIKHYGGIDYEDGVEMGIKPDVDLVDIAILLGSVDVYYEYPSDSDFTIVQVNNNKYLIKIRTTIFGQLIRLLTSCKYQVNFSNSVDKKIRKSGGLSD